MKKRSAWRHAWVFVALTALTLAAMLGWAYPDEAARRLGVVAGQRVDPAELASPVQPRAAVSFQMAPLAVFAEVADRPLFAADRRPHRIAVTRAAPAPPVVLSGIVIGPEGRYALIRDGASPAAKRVGEGQPIGSGTVKRITPDYIEISAGDGSDIVINLFVPSATKVGNNQDAAAAAQSGTMEPRTQRPTAPSASAAPGATAIGRNPG